MGICKFTNELNRLRKSSSDSIDNTEYFDDFKKYMHVTRTAETDLKEILRNVNHSNKKTLVLLCGSAGDGKSHLLSYLKNCDEEHLIDNYTIYNDATESSAPSKTAIETLYDLLSPFTDNKLEFPGKNVILAINLGVLSNFIESEYGIEFTKLHKYVEESNILTNQINNNNFDENGHFQHVSFSDYHMYSLTEEGVRADYIGAIFNKIFMKKDKNIFYQAYKSECMACPLSMKCPVKMNYEFMMEERHQVYIAQLLIETVIKDKMILTTREILNFVYNIIVSQDFSYTNIQKFLVDESLYLRNFLKQITPSLLFGSKDVSSLLNMVMKYDPLQIRNERTDESAISYYVSSDVGENLESVLKWEPYGSILCDNSVISKINSDKELKLSLYNLMIRINAFEEKFIQDDIYKMYLSDLFFYNAGKARRLANLYGMIEKAIAQWCGSDEDGNLCIDDKHRDFSFYEHVEYNANLVNLPRHVDETEIQRFIPSIVTSFNGDNNEIISLDIDYSLYELLAKLNAGYIQTADDRNNHADFISFVDRIIQTGQLSKSVTIISEDGKKAIISLGTFGYKFKVVK